MRINLHPPRRNDTLCGRLLRRVTMMPPKQPTQQALFLPASTNRLRLLSLSIPPRLRRPTGKGLTLGILMRILLPLLHLLPKLLRLLLIREAESKQRILPLEGVEERPVLVILEGIVDLLIPDHASIRGADVYELDPERVAHQVVREYGSALQAGVGPL